MLTFRLSFVLVWIDCFFIMPKLFVANISFQSTDADYAALFQQYPDAENMQIMRNRASGVSRGFGFVTVGDDLADKLCKGEVSLVLV